MILDKAKMAHEWAMKHGKVDSIYNREETVQLAWGYADTMQAEQSFHIVSKIHAVNPRTGEAVDVEFQLATPQTMHLWQFLGDADSDLYIEEAGIKMKWLGFNSELEKYLEEIEGEFKIVTNHCCLTCFSSFKSFRHEVEFKSIKLMNQYGLGVAA